MNKYVTKCCWNPPLNFTSSTSLSLSIMLPLGLKVWQGQCTLISNPWLLPDGKQVWKKRIVKVSINSQFAFKKLNAKEKREMFVFFGLNTRWSLRLMIALETTNGGDHRLTSVHQPFPHSFSHIKGDPFWGSSGQHVLGSNVALFPDVFVWPYNLQVNNKRSKTASTK